MSKIILTSSLALPPVKLNRQSLYKLFDLCIELFKAEEEDITFKVMYQEVNSSNNAKVLDLELVKQMLNTVDELRYIEIDIHTYNFSKRLQVEINRYYNHVVSIELISDEEFWITQASSVLKDFFSTITISGHNSLCDFLCKSRLGFPTIALLIFFPVSAVLVMWQNQLFKEELPLSFMLLFSLLMFLSTFSDWLCKFRKPISSNLCFIDNPKKRPSEKFIFRALKAIFLLVAGYFITVLLDKLLGK